MMVPVAQRHWNCLNWSAWESLELMLVPKAWEAMEVQRLHLSLESMVAPPGEAVSMETLVFQLVLAVTRALAPLKALLAEDLSPAELEPREAQALEPMLHQELRDLWSCLCLAQEQEPVGMVFAEHLRYRLTPVDFHQEAGWHWKAAEQHSF